MRNYLHFGTINDEGIRLIAKLGAAPMTLLRSALEDFEQAPLRGKWSKSRLIITIVACLDPVVSRDAPRMMEEALIHHGLWAGAKRYRK